MTIFAVVDYSHFDKKKPLSKVKVQRFMSTLAFLTKIIIFCSTTEV